MNTEPTLHNLKREQPLQKNPYLFKHVLWIEPGNVQREALEFIHEGICFHHIPLIEEASLLMHEAKFEIDAAVISPEHSNTEILKIKEDAEQAGVPLIIYTPIFSRKASNLSIRLVIDEYFYGDFGNLFQKRIEFLRKVKKYKKRKSHQQGIIMFLNALPKIGHWALKRTFDLFGSFIALLAFFPVMLIIAIIVRLGSKGPVFITRKRVGLGHKIFDLYKLRTKPFKCEGTNQYDFSKFLEARGLDELPSLINVLKGDMSLVGCKPLKLNEAVKLSRDQMSMRIMTPVGFTGWWRIKEKKMSKTQQTRLEIEYAMKNSFWMDMKILFSTFVSKPQHQKA